MHGAGSPQAQRIQIARQMQLEYKMKLARKLANIPETEAEDLGKEQSDYFDRIFSSKKESS
jgi:4-hydroxybutyryl-CoA dehydratase / vinylacetyl-CoA-Delta-isomerase